MRRIARIGAWVGIALAFAGCPGNAPSALTDCATMHIGPEGGTLTGARGTTVIFPNGSVGRGADMTLCLVETGHVPRQHSDMIELGPPGAPIFVPVSVTMPVDATTPSTVVAEVRATPFGSLDGSVTVAHADGAPFVTFSLGQVGDVRIVEAAPPIDGGGPTDGGPGIDVNRPDAPRPVGPVVVGPDLRPADYGCLGTRVIPPVHPGTPVTVHAADWADHSLRAGYVLRVSSTPIVDPSGTCALSTDCHEGTTDASGDVTLLVNSGPVFVNVAPSSLGGPDAAHVPAQHWSSGLTLAVDATTLEVAALSARTQNQIISGFGIGGFVLGTVRDCADAPVQRVRVRAFDAMTGVEVMTSPLGGRPVTYGNMLGFPSGNSDRSVIDGVYLTAPNGGPDMRIEAWGKLTIDGADVLLACETFSIVSGAPMLVDLRPLSSSAPSACGSAP